MSSYGTIIQFVPASVDDLKEVKNLTPTEKGKYLDHDTVLTVMFPVDGGKPYLLPVD